MEIPPEMVFERQKMMISKCRAAGKPCVVATQMLESMITNPRPTRAECSDVANAVLDGADCVMLSGETANGSFPVDAVSIMARTCIEAEGLKTEQDPSGLDDLFTFIRQRKEAEENVGPVGQAEAVASTAVKIAGDIGSKAIIVLSETGETARLVAKFHPEAKILAICADSRVARQIEGYMSNSVAVASSIKRSTQFYYGNSGQGAHVRLAFEKGKEFAIFGVGDVVPVVSTIRDESNEKRWTVRMLNVLPSKGKFDDWARIEKKDVVARPITSPPHSRVCAGGSDNSLAPCVIT